MITNIKRSIKHTVIYGLGTIASKLIGLILLPLYTVHFSVSDFGLYGLFEIVLQLLPIVGLGMPSALQRWLGLKEFAAKRGKLLFTSFVFFLIYLILLLVLLSFLSTIIGPLLFEQDYSKIFYLIFVIIYFQLITRIALVLLRMDEKSGYFAIANSLKIAIQLLSIIYLITVKHMGFISIFYGELAGTIFLFISTLPYLLKNMQPGFEKKELIEMIKFGAPAIFGNFAPQIFSFIDRGLLSRLGSEAAVGRYVLGFKISNIIGTLLITSFNIALPSIAWEQVGTENQNRFFSKMLTYLTFVLIWAGLFVAAFSKGIIHQFALDRSYWDAVIIIPVLVAGMTFNGMHVIINYGLLVSKKTQRIPFIIFTCAVIDIIINIIFIPNWGFTGTAFAMMVTALSRTVITYLFSKKYFLIQWEFRKILLMFLVALLLFFVTAFFDNYELVYRIMLKGLVLLLFPFILYFFNFYEQIEIETIKRISKKYLNHFKFNG